jgi:hypothetical protein
VELPEEGFEPDYSLYQPVSSGEKMWHDSKNSAKIARVLRSLLWKAERRNPTAGDERGIYAGDSPDAWFRLHPMTDSQAVPSSTTLLLRFGP